MKYAINKEFFPLYYFKNPIRNAKLAGFVGSLLKPPKWLFKDEKISARREMIKSYDGQMIEVLIFEPRTLSIDKAPCLVYLHGGGFVFGAADQQYKIVREYILQVNCRAVFVNYRLAPKHPHPTPAEDCYAGLRYAFENADALGIDKNRIGVGGDSAGGALSAAVCQMARDRGTDAPIFQLLVYPATDITMNTESNRRFTDTPLWNSRLSKMMWPAYVPDMTRDDICYAAPMQAKFFGDLPTAYVETAEFDCLHDEAINYANAMMNAGVEVEIYETKGTMHGFDGKLSAPTSQECIKRRSEFMKKHFE